MSQDFVGLTATVLVAVTRHSRYTRETGTIGSRHHQPALAQATWTGAVGGAWSAGFNWSPLGVPAGGVNTSLGFGATSNAAMSDDLPGTFILNQFTLNAGAPAYSLTGTALDFRTSGGNNLPSIVLNSNNGVTIGNALTITNGLRICLVEQPSVHRLDQGVPGDEVKLHGQNAK